MTMTEDEMRKALEHDTARKLVEMTPRVKFRVTSDVAERRVNLAVVLLAAMPAVRSYVEASEGPDTRAVKRALALADMLMEEATR